MQHPPTAVMNRARLPRVAATHLLLGFDALLVGMMVVGATFGGGLYGCSDVRLEVPRRAVVDDSVDNLLSISGQFCASPQAEVTFPIKVMFVVDGSGSMQFTDQNRQRVAAVEETINALVGSGSAYFKIIVFNASVYATPPIGTGPVFSNDVTLLAQGLNDLAQADTVTDYQGALAMAYGELVRDMSTTSRVVLGRTKYVIIFISDGFPDPQCRAGLGNDFDPNFPDGLNHLCEDGDFLSCVREADGSRCGSAESLGYVPGQCPGDVCEFNNTACCRVNEASTLFGGLADDGLAAGGDYNQPYQILTKVDDVMSLQERFDVGELRLHSALVLDPNADPTTIEVFGDATQAIPLMQQVAVAGGGRYMEFYGGDAIDFLSLNFTSLKQERVLRGFFADNRAAKLTPGGWVSDSDFDGLPDNKEIEIGTNPLMRDTDVDGYSDLFEWLRRGYSFDPKDPCMPPVVELPSAIPGDPCDPAAPPSCMYDLVMHNGVMARQYRDADRDGMHDCEEHQLALDPANPDTDGDGLPDGMELEWGLNPARWDTDDDLDQDGLSNNREILWHLDPLHEQSPDSSRERYRYSLPQSETTDATQQACYLFTVHGVQLVDTGNSRDLGSRGFGYNEIRLTIVEGLAGETAGTSLVRQACLHPRYVSPTLKVPANGQWTLVETDFGYLPSSDPIFNPANMPIQFDETTCLEAH